MTKKEMIEAEKQIIELVLVSGDTVQEVAERFKVHRKTIYRVLQRNSVISYPKKKQEITQCECCGGEIKQSQNKHRKNCSSCITAIRRIRLKNRCLEYKGGVCTHCGLKSKNFAVYDFHHLDPNEKDFGFGVSSMVSKPWSVIRMELDKCVLLCSNCHRIEHSQHDKYSKYLEHQNKDKTVWVTENSLK